MGPRTMDKIILKELIAGGMNVARFNFSHGSYEEQFSISYFFLIAYT